MGYYGLFIGLEYRHDMAMTSRFERNDYSEDQTISFKVPLSVPYANDQQEFERVDGKFEYDGESYRLIKQKYANDTLTVVCYRDHQNSVIADAMSDYVKTFANAPSEKQSDSKVTVSFIKDYIAQTFSIECVTAGWQSDVAFHSSSFILFSSFSPSIVHPPEQD
jgi:hypothetical protein